MQKSLQNSNSQPQKSGRDLKALMREVLAASRQEGASDACVAVSEEDGFSIDVRMGEVDTVSFHEATSVAVTVYFGQRQGSASSTDLSPASLQSMVTAACDIAKVSAVDPCFGLADKDLVPKELPALDLYHPWAITPQEAIELVRNCEQHALAVDSRITNSDGVGLSTYVFCTGYADTYGRDELFNSSRHSLSCSLIAKSNETMQRDYAYTTARLASKLQPEIEIAKLAADRVLNRLDAQKLKTQHAPVLFSSRVSNSLFGAFINAISGGNLYRKSTFLLDSLGKQVFPSYIRIHEQPHILQALGSSPVDAEGVLTRNNVFVEDGCVKQYVLGSYSARRLGLATTANSGGVFNLTIDPTDGDFIDMLRKMDRGLLVTELMGHGVNGLTGDYSRGASGFWVEHGEIQYPVEEITIAGNLQDMFRQIVAVGSDIDPNRSTHCGSVLLEQMTIAGH